MRLAYDGRGFHGFASQPGCRTVAGVLMDALKDITYSCDGIVCAGRTDAGVHARDQVIHVDINVGAEEAAERGTEEDAVGGGAGGGVAVGGGAGSVGSGGVGGSGGKGVNVVTRLVSPGSIARSLNRMLSPEVVILQAGIAPAGFDARYSATSRSYSYAIMNTLYPDPLIAHQVWHVRTPLDVRSMRTAADCILGAHDFSAFCRRKKGDKSGAPIIREVLHAGLVVRKWDERWWYGEGLPGSGELRGGEGLPGSAMINSEGATGHGGSINSGSMITFEVTARSFCHQMVRSLVGMLVEVGRGRSTPADLYSLLQGRSRVSFVAPPEGLCLARVDYNGIGLLGEE